MRIDKLQVHNFRGFSDTEIVLNGKDAIFYGVNGMGKSSILDVCNLLFSRIMQEAAQDEQITASLLGEKDVKVGEEEAKITLFLEDQGNNFHYYRKRIQGKNLHNSKELKRVSEYMRKQYLGDCLETEEEYENDDTETPQKEFTLNNENIPVYVFYGVDRYNEKTRKLRRRYTGAAGKLDAWRDSAFGGVINFRLFFEWFRGRQEYENSIRVETPNAEDPQLHAVKKSHIKRIGRWIFGNSCESNRRRCGTYCHQKRIGIGILSIVRRRKKCNRTGRRSEPEAGNCKSKEGESAGRGWHCAD